MALVGEVFQTRSLSTKIINKGFRVNSRRILKPSVEIKVNDVLTLHLKICTRDKGFVFGRKESKL